MRGSLFTDPFPFATLPSMLIALGLATIKGPMEEFGWRGVALLLLQRKLAPIWAGLVLGIIWGLWHLPAFMLSGTQQSQWAVAPFFRRMHRLERHRDPAVQRLVREHPARGPVSFHDDESGSARR